MLIIVAHHYVVNSGLTGRIMHSQVIAGKDIFLLLFGWGGKTGIDCFVLITGYFMCKSHITLRKFVKLVGEIEFYKIVIRAIFWISGYEVFSIKNFVKTLLPLYWVGDGFTNSYLLFFLFIPFINRLIESLSEKEYRRLLEVSILSYTIIPTFLKTNPVLSYVTWFIILYLIAAYIRFYPKKNMMSLRYTGCMTLIMLILSWASVISRYILGIKMHKPGLWYYMVADSNKVLALATAVYSFLFFKNIDIGVKPWINKIAASTFGVLMIHANCDAMRRWLWEDILNNAGMYDSRFLVLHAFLSVIGVYFICTVLDRIRIRWIETPFFIWFDRKKFREIF